MSEDADITLDSLEKQTFQGFRVLVVKDQGNGANWARNEGFKKVDTEFVLFSDNDIDWKPNALEKMLRVLRMTKASYSYGRFYVEQTLWGHEPWNPLLLKHHNYISTMSLWRTKDFPGFDESIQRLQDWDVYLTALEQGKRGVYCNDLIFTTKVRKGITHGGPDLVKSERIVRLKHGLDLLEFTEPTE